MNIIVIGEYSAEVREAFARRGHNAWSCDLLPSEVPGKHLQCDCRLLNYDSFDMVVAHPDCTCIANSGVRWLREIPGRWGDMVEAAVFFRWVLDLPNRYPNIRKLVAENPIPHKYALSIIGRKYSQIIQPWQFGHGETKATCLWLHGVDKLVPTDVVEGREHRIHRMAPSDDRKKERSRTYHGIAEAMAEQWG